MLVLVILHQFCKILSTAVCTFSYFNMFWLNVTFITTNLQYSKTNRKQTKLHGLFLNHMFNIPVSTFTFSVKIVILPRESPHSFFFINRGQLFCFDYIYCLLHSYELLFTCEYDRLRGRFTLVHFFHKAVKVHDPAPNNYFLSLFQLPVGYLGRFLAH